MFNSRKWAEVVGVNTKRNSKPSGNSVLEPIA
jgi:hypothetical protein